MKRIFQYSMLSSIMIIIGILYGAFAHNILIIHSPFFSSQRAVPQDTSINISKKKVTLFFWHNDTWNKEEIDLIWSPNTQKTLKYLINSWLTLLEEDDIQEKRIGLQSVAIHNKNAYISLDRNPFDKAMPIIEKWLWIEGLLKTIRENKIDIKTVQLLVHHKVLHDYHLDFSNPWPIEGFFEH